jgi:pyruvate dehydrogenase E2 component (dihydrolipoamide acetyltransferase)
LSLVAKALLIALRSNPSVNSSWDEDTQEIVTKHYVNLGIAAATPRGLMVPNIKGANALGLKDLALALTDLTTTAKEGKTGPADLADGTITITNVGVFGVDAGTPILNPGEAAILCFGSIRRRPWEFKGDIALRSVTTLSLSFDHRLVDGEQGSKFLAAIADILSDPINLIALN